MQGEGADRDAVLEKIRITCRETLPQEFHADTDENRGYDADVLNELMRAYQQVERMVGMFCVDYTDLLVHRMRARSWRVLVEGCNGLLLDNLHGAHPNVTSTSTNIGALMCGAHLSPADVGVIFVVMGAYATSLGKRFMATEMTEQEARTVYARCVEIDPAEGKQRRLAWLDLPGLRKALAGATGAVLHMNKLDVLTGINPLKMCTHYRIDGRDWHTMPDDPRVHARAEAQYLTLEGWNEEIQHVRTWDELPVNARRYVRTVQELLPNRVVSLGVGPRNEDVVRL